MEIEKFLLFGEEPEDVVETDPIPVEGNRIKIEMGVSIFLVNSGLQGNANKTFVEYWIYKADKKIKYEDINLQDFDPPIAVVREKRLSVGKIVELDFLRPGDYLLKVNLESTYHRGVIAGAIFASSLIIYADKVKKWERVETAPANQSTEFSQLFNVTLTEG